MGESSGRKVKTVGLFIVCFVILSAAGLTYLNKKKHSHDQYVSGMIPSSDMNNRTAPPKEQQSHESVSQHNKPSIEERLVNELRKFYGDTISQKSTQVKLLKVKAFVSQLYPKDGEKRFYAILKKAFPDLADEILGALVKMEQYKAWLEDNEHRLSEMNRLEKEGLIWEKRRELMGDDAEEIWSDEVVAFEKKKIELRETLSYLDEADDLTIYEKLTEYESTLKDVYEDSPEEFVLQNRSLHAKVFFSIESVQKELKQMDPDQRQMQMNNIRREMGFTQEEVERMEEMDAYRERRWENGLAYMEEREGLAKEFEGEELENKLDALRETYFKHEAKTIKFEEEDGFFRFNRPRIYGRN